MTISVCFPVDQVVQFEAIAAVETNLFVPVESWWFC
jgi:hypothetical protein